MRLSGDDGSSSSVDQERRGGIAPERFRKYVLEATDPPGVAAVEAIITSPSFTSVKGGRR